MLPFSFIRQLIISFIVILGLIMTSTTGASESQNIEKRLEQLQADIKNLSTDIEQSTKKMDKTTKVLQQLEQDIHHISLNQHQLNQIILEKQSTLKQLQTEYIERSRLLSKQKKQLKEQIRAIYLLSKNPPIKLLFSSTSQTQTPRLFGYYHFFSTKHQVNLANNLSKLDQLSTLKTSVQNQYNDIQKQQQQLNAQSQLANKAYKSRTLLLKHHQNQIASKSKTLSLQQHDEKVLLEQLKQLKRKSNQLKPPITKHPPAVPQNIQWPLTSFNHLQGKSAVFTSTLGSQVKSIHHGQVVFADWLRGYGLLIIVDHGQSLMSLYGHNQTLFKKKGDWVTSGEVIALVGQSGGHAQPGLYFEIRKDGHPVDLAKWKNHEITY